MENPALIRDLLEWIAKEPRAYKEVMDAWKTSCPRLTIWEDAFDNGFLRHAAKQVIITEKGRAFLQSEKQCQT